MTKEGRNPNTQSTMSASVSGLGIRHSFVIWSRLAGSFVIFDRATFISAHLAGLYLPAR